MGKRLSSSGGAAMGGGQRFQARVTAWWAGRILLQTRVGQSYDIPVTATAERVWSETTDSVDDLRVEFSSRHRIYGQCKSYIAIGTDVDGEWAKALLQCASEYERAIANNTTDEVRLVVFYEDDNRNAHRLGALLDAYRASPVAKLVDVATNQWARDAAKDLNDLLDAAQKEHVRNAGTPLRSLAQARAEFTRHLYVRQLRLAEGQTDNVALIDALQGGLLETPSQSTIAIESLHRLADDLIADHGTRDRSQLRQRLSDRQVTLQASVDFRSDFERLDAWTSAQLAAHDADGRDRLRLGTSSVTLDRECNRTIVNSDESFLVVGAAGTGKSGSLLLLAHERRASHKPVWYWAADALAGHSIPEIETHLRLRYTFNTLFAEAAATGLTLVIDGLDGLRDARVQGAYRDVLRVALRAGVQVVASIRTFDLTYSIQLQDGFRRAADSALPRNAGFGHGVSYVVISELDDGELDVVAKQLPKVADVLTMAKQLRGVVRNLFSLDLLCRLLDDGATAVELSALATQAELFDRYWARRIEASSNRHELESALGQLVERMVANRALQIDSSGIDGRAIAELQSAGVLRVPPRPSGVLSDEQTVEFTHHVLFDYVAERLYVRPRRKQLASEFASKDPWPLFLRPSIALFYAYAWRYGRAELWMILEGLEAAHVSGLHRFTGYSVAADAVVSRADLQPVFLGSTSSGASQRNWRTLLLGIINAVTASALPKLLESGRGCWWVELARDLIATNDRELIYAGRGLVWNVSDQRKKLDAECVGFLNEIAQRLIRFHRAEGDTSLQVRRSIAWLTETIMADLAGSTKLIREMLDDSELRRAGFVQVPALADCIPSLAPIDATLAREVYDAAFEYHERSDAPTPMGSAVLRMRSTRRQDFDMARYSLDKHFDSLFEASPIEATRAVIHMAGRKESDFRSAELTPLETFKIGSTDCHVRDDPGRRMQLEHRAGNYAGSILDQWADALKALPEDSVLSVVKAVVGVLGAENESAAVWAHFFEAQCSAVQAHEAEGHAGLCTEIAALLGTALECHDFLAGHALDDVAPICLEALGPWLGKEQGGRIELAILSLPIELFAQYREPEKRRENAQAFLLQRLPQERRGSKAESFLRNWGDRPADPPPQPPRITVSSSAVTRQSLLVDRGEDPEDPDNAEILSALGELDKFQEFFSDDESEDGTTEANESTPAATESEVDQREEDQQQAVEADEASDAELPFEVAAQRIEDAERALKQAKGNQTLREELVASVLRRKAELIDRAGKNFPDELVEPFLSSFMAVIDDPPKAVTLEQAAQFDDFQAWGGNDARVYAAMGIMALAARKGLRIDRIRQAIETLSGDPEPAVRFHVAARIWVVLDNWPDLVWASLELWISQLGKLPGAAGSLKGGLRQGWYWWLARRDPSRAHKLLLALADHARTQGDEELQQIAGQQLAAVSFLELHDWSIDRLRADVQVLEASSEEVSGALRELLDATLMPSEKRLSTIQSDCAIKLSTEIATGAALALKLFNESYQRTLASERPAELPKWVTNVLHLLTIVGHELRQSAEQLLRGGVKRGVDEWWKASEPLFEALLTYPLAEPLYSAAEGLIEMGASDSARALHWLARLSVAGDSIAVSRDSLMADKVIDYLGRVLAAEGGVLASNDALRADFLKTLDVYLNIGWPRAIDLALRIETLYR